ncbi:molybdopterin-dependent oxidoreductase [Marinicella sp. W31]|uniref:molybdopterin-dependent oxidoreductase n=1 Tax=Marinicella sp. W31 TaxID=3023713 RepID=UPI003757072A
MLPKGQYDIGKMPRFGMSKFADRIPQQIDAVKITISGDVENTRTFDTEIAALPRTEIKADFHCVTTWSALDQVWEGVLFKDFFNQLVLPETKPMKNANFIVMRAQDGYRACLPLDDLLSDNVMLADTLNGEPLGIEHGAPLRLIAPDHYGYKNVKHIQKIDFLLDNSNYRPSGLKFMEHPRARVEKEERGRFFPGWLLRYVYRPAIKSTISSFERALISHKEKKQ